jgi:hypothetical protein
MTTDVTMSKPAARRQIAEQYGNGDVPHVVTDPARARAVLGLTAKVDRPGLREFTIASLRD